MGIRVLLVEDDEKLRHLVKTYLIKEGYHVMEAKDGYEALLKFEEKGADLIILDIMLPDSDGFTVCKKIRKEDKVPIIMLTARSEENDKLLGFELGADDYVTKPFSPKELMARINAVITRHNAQSQTQEKSDEIVFDGLKINIPARTVEVDGEKVEMTPKEYDLLFYLVENKNLALSRDTLLQDIWGYDFFGDDRTIDTHIKNLRGNLGPYRDKISTVRGIGYRFED